jgi:hypothetical protein
VRLDGAPWWRSRCQSEPPPATSRLAQRPQPDPGQTERDGHARSSTVSRSSSMTAPGTPRRRWPRQPGSPRPTNVALISEKNSAEGGDVAVGQDTVTHPRRSRRDRGVWTSDRERPGSDPAGEVSDGHVLLLDGRDIGVGDDLVVVADEKPKVTEHPRKGVADGIDRPDVLLALLRQRVDAVALIVSDPLLLLVVDHRQTRRALTFVDAHDGPVVAGDGRAVDTKLPGDSRLHPRPLPVLSEKLEHPVTTDDRLVLALGVVAASATSTRDHLGGGGRPRPFVAHF